MPISRNLKKIEERVIEALQSRGFSVGESQQMVARLKANLDFDEIAETRLSFGKYAGMTIEQIAKERLSYLTWLTGQDWFIEKKYDLYQKIAFFLKENYGAEITEIIKRQKEEYNSKRTEDDIPF